MPEAIIPKTAQLCGPRVHWQEEQRPRGHPHKSGRPLIRPLRAPNHGIIVPRLKLTGCTFFIQIPLFSISQKVNLRKSPALVESPHQHLPLFARFQATAVTQERGQTMCRPTRSVMLPIGSLAERIASLDEKFRDDTMKGRSVKKIHFDEIDEIFHVSWGIIGKKAKLNRPERCRDGRFGVFLFELNWWSTRHSDHDCIKGQERSASLERERGKFYLAVWLLRNGRVERLDGFGCKKQEPQVEHLRLLLGWLFVSWVNPRRLFRLK